MRGLERNGGNRHNSADLLMPNLAVELMGSARTAIERIAFVCEGIAARPSGGRWNVS